MKRISKTEWQLIQRIFLITVALTIVGMIIPVLKGMFVKGLWFGSVFSMLKVRWIALTMQRGAERSKGNAYGYMISQVLLRYVLTLLILFTAIQDSLIGFLGAAIGVSLLKIATFFYPVHGERG